MEEASRCLEGGHRSPIQHDQILLKEKVVKRIASWIILLTVPKGTVRIGIDTKNQMFIVRFAIVRQSPQFPGDNGRMQDVQVDRGHIDVLTINGVLPDTRSDIFVGVFCGQPQIHTQNGRKCRCARACWRRQKFCRLHQGR